MLDPTFGSISDNVHNSPRDSLINQFDHTVIQFFDHFLSFMGNIRKT